MGWKGGEVTGTEANTLAINRLSVIENAKSTIITLWDLPPNFAEQPTTMWRKKSDRYEKEYSFVGSHIRSIILSSGLLPPSLTSSAPCSFVATSEHLGLPTAPEHIHRVVGALVGPHQGRAPTPYLRVIAADTWYRKPQERPSDGTAMVRELTVCAVDIRQLTAVVGRGANLTVNLKNYLHILMRR